MTTTSDTIQIPKIIHQIWLNTDKPLPKVSQILGNTWKRDYPEWEYILWDNDKTNNFLTTYYPQYLEIYNKFPYNIQRCDAIRYLILDQIGGMYVDSDYESIHSMESLLKNKYCCFSEEPNTHRGGYGKNVERYFNNAMMLSTKHHPFMQKIIKEVFSDDGKECNIHSFDYVLRTTGPWKLMDIYYDLSEREQENIYLIPKEHVTPFDFSQARQFIRKEEGYKDLDSCLNDAYAVHYFFSSWRKEIK